MRYHTWRKLWLNLAIAEKELGLPISDLAISQMKENLVGIEVITWSYSVATDLSDAALGRGTIQSSSRRGEEAKT
jgi:hypothetical protein